MHTVLVLVAYAHTRTPRLGGWDAQLDSLSSRASCVPMAAFDQGPNKRQAMHRCALTTHRRLLSPKLPSEMDGRNTLPLYIYIYIYRYVARDNGSCTFPSCDCYVVVVVAQCALCTMPTTGALQLIPHNNVCTCVYIYIYYYTHTHNGGEWLHAGPLLACARSCSFCQPASNRNRAHANAHTRRSCAASPSPPPLRERRDEGESHNHTCTHAT